MKALKAISWPMVSSRSSTSVAPTHSTAMVVAAFRTWLTSPTRMWKDWAWYCFSSALAYLRSQRSRTGRSMPMPFTVSAPPSVSIRYDLASVEAANTSRA
ncbi:hypothetical protein D3C87_1336020 [compost metagenome]